MGVCGETAHRTASQSGGLNRCHNEAWECRIMSYRRAEDRNNLSSKYSSHAFLPSQKSRHLCGHDFSDHICRFFWPPLTSSPVRTWRAAVRGLVKNKLTTPWHYWG
ncbi:hypothetical protein RSal33209_0577 [Renibacterium salmoninarum ATCC 33209]|uniref:Uncharacterized protein n=1 Tax=Renibacterium salmoninarum (strain ATCC 33209 / DSM 20767 / JCM 11484 / NBRC 15589 / NCIMB 2235) TaxID=288705 RepID=A9WLC7_RENSM|nr:hypothetical protein RSal33209_0577 [Renibacterium salmoninarum ATCC 33209]